MVWILVYVGASVVFFAFMMTAYWSCSKRSRRSQRRGSSMSLNTPVGTRLHSHEFLPDEYTSNTSYQSERLHRLTWPSPMGMGDMAVEGQVTGIFNPQNEESWQEQQSYSPPRRIAVEGTILETTGVSSEYQG